MNRREMILGSAVIGLGVTTIEGAVEADRLKRERPWAKRAEELFATEGHYADYAAWQEWLTAEMNRVFDGELAEDVWNTDYLTPIALYVLFCRAYDGDEA